MSNNVFPTLAGLGWNWLKVPRNRTHVHPAVSGREVRVKMMQYSLFDYSLSYDLVRDTTLNADLNTIMGFYQSRGGAYDDFLLEDPDDYTVEGQSLGTGDGSTTEFQFVRTKGTYVTPIYDLQSSPSPVVYLNGVVVNPVNYTIDQFQAGTITFNTAPLNGVAITADFDYYFRVRFKEDTLEFEKFMQNLWQLNQVDLVGVKP